MGGAVAVLGRVCVSVLWLCGALGTTKRRVRLNHTHTVGLALAARFAAWFPLTPLGHDTVDRTWLRATFTPLFPLEVRAGLASTPRLLAVIFTEVSGTLAVSTSETVAVASGAAVAASAVGGLPHWVAGPSLLAWLAALLGTALRALAPVAYCPLRVQRTIVKL